MNGKAIEVFHWFHESGSNIAIVNHDGIVLNHRQSHGNVLSFHSEGKNSMDWTEQITSLNKKLTVQNKASTMMNIFQHLKMADIFYYQDGYNFLTVFIFLSCVVVLAMSIY